MKLFKKLTSILLAMAMMLAMGAAAFAANEPVSGEKYKAYKIFDRTSSEEAYAYSIDANSVWYNVVNAYKTQESYSGSLTLTQSADKTKYVVKGLSENEAAAFAAYLKADMPAGAVVAAEKTASTEEVAFSGLTEGYYLVTSSLGATVATTDGSGNLSLVEKNSVPSVDKDLTNVNDAYAQIGDTIGYTVKVNTGKGANQAITLTDTMSSSLTLDTNSFNVKVNGTEVSNEDDTNYTLNTNPGEGDSWTFKITFDEDYIKSLAAETDIVVTYSATLNANAVTVDATNTASINYSNQTDTDTTNTKTNSFQVKKYAADDSTKANLAGATFKLTDADGTTIKLVKIDDQNYRVAEADEQGAVETFTTVASGNITIKGVDSDKTYKLVETEAPKGYNLLTGPVTVGGENRISAENTTVEEVPNSAGQTLPTTGGMGTTLLYTVGALLVLGAGVTLVVRRRMDATK